MKYLLSRIEAIGSELDAIPDPDKTSREISTREVVRVLAPRLATLERRGHTLDQIAGLLAERGIAISKVSLRRHLRRVRVPGRGHVEAGTGGVAAVSPAATRTVTRTQAAPAPPPTADPAKVTGRNEGGPKVGTTAAPGPTPKPTTATFIPRKDRNEISTENEPCTRTSTS